MNLWQWCIATQGPAGHMLYQLAWSLYLVSILMEGSHSKLIAEFEIDVEKSHT